jgi:DNA-binding transcriptional LysR family regulator
MVPGVVLRFQAKNQALKSVPIELPTTFRPLAIITLKNRTLSSVARLFIDYAREAAKPLTVKTAGIKPE